MVGTIFGLGLSQQIGADGEPLAGALLYLYTANTSTPVTAYEDFGLTSGLEHPFPIVADAAGRIPSFWLADGAYRVRLTDADGNELFDESSITAIGASSGVSSGGGTSTTSSFDTGDMIWTMGSGARTGFVRANGRTIGNSASGASERASADTEALFTFLWNSIVDAWAPVAGGRGVSAAADFAANKKIVVPSMQGRVAAGADDMGNTAAGVLSGKTVIGESTGAETTVIATSALPAHTHTPGTLATSTHTHAISNTAHTHSNTDHTHSNAAHTHSGEGRDSLLPVSTGAAGPVWKSTQSSVLTIDAASISIAASSISIAASSISIALTGAAALSVATGITGATGSGGTISLAQPYRIGTWYIKL
jgi:hypothetical protein